jgi:hypothetical protein
MKRSKRVQEIEVTATVHLDTLYLQEDQAFALIEAVDLQQAESGFTTEVILRLIKSMKAEFKDAPDELEDFITTVGDALK